MPQKLSEYFVFLPEVAAALQAHKPVVALETAVVTHGLPYPVNLQLAVQMEQAVREQGCTPATIGLLEGKVYVGLSQAQVEALASQSGLRKISRRDYAAALAQHASGGTTVAGTMAAAHLAGIRVFATGGIGGVHREARFDVSADLPELGRTPMIVVCAGAKSILDLPATLEVLETSSVPVIGYQSNEFPAFYARSSGLKAPMRSDSPEEISRIARAHWNLGNQSAVLVVNPPPSELAMAAEEMEAAVAQAIEEAHTAGIAGQAVTPYLLGRMNELTGGASLQANLALLLNNARLAAQIARALQPGMGLSA